MFDPGNIVLIRTAVYHALGKVVGIVMVGGVPFVHLTEAAYIGDTGRFSEATKVPLDKVDRAEIEPVADGQMLVQVAMICDVVHAMETVRTVV